MEKEELLTKLKEQNFSERIIDAFRKIRREDFIPDEFKHLAYSNEPVPIGFGQTISQPYTIAFMLNLLEIEGKDNLKILEIGSGSGYVLALMNEISRNSEIYGIERLEDLVKPSERRLKNHNNIKIIHGDGSRGLIEYAPYDKILISASCKKIPENLYSQLNENGIIVASVNRSIFQIKKNNDKIGEREFQGFVFVPLIED